MIKSKNPALKTDFLQGLAQTGSSSDVMTVNGTITKTAILGAILILSASVTWQMALSATSTLAIPLAIGGVIGGLILALIISFNQKSAPYLAPVYAVAEGLFLGAISALLNAAYEGIVTKAIFLTFAILASMLVLYRLRIIKVTNKFKMVVFTATMGIFVFYALTFVLGLFGVHLSLFGAGTIGLLISLGIVIVAALWLAIDFDYIEEGAALGAPKYVEWYAAFGLMVTLVWLYVEILRLLTLLTGRD